MNGYSDIHTHILPGVDDGAPDMSQALELIRMAYQDGTRAMILTPHYRGRFKRNSPERLREVFHCLCQAVEEQLPGMRVYLGNEIYYEVDAPELLESGRILSMNDSQYCLLEFRTGALRSEVIMGVSEMVRCGFVPIIAHAERYDIFRKDKSLTDDVMNYGALIQLNADSILGEHGFRVKWFCEGLLEARKVHFIATDAHDTQNRPPLLGKCWHKVQKKYGSEYAEKLFCDNGQAVIENKMI